MHGSDRLSMLSVYVKTSSTCVRLSGPKEIAENKPILVFVRKPPTVAERQVECVTHHLQHRAFTPG